MIDLLLSNRIKINYFIGSIHSGSARMPSINWVFPVHSLPLSLASTERGRNQLDDNSSDLNSSRGRRELAAIDAIECDKKLLFFNVTDT